MMMTNDSVQKFLAKVLLRVAIHAPSAFITLAFVTHAITVAGRGSRLSNLVRGVVTRM